MCPINNLVTFYNFTQEKSVGKNAKSQAFYCPTRAKRHACFNSNYRPFVHNETRSLNLNGFTDSYSLKIFFSRQKTVIKNVPIFTKALVVESKS